MTSEQYAQLLDDFELGADVGPDEDLTSYIERRRREFESKADGGSIGIEVFFGPKRGEYQTGGQAYDPRASIQDYAEAVAKVSGGTTAQKLQDIGRYTTGKLGLTQKHFDTIAAMKSDPQKFGINKQIDYAKLSGKDLVKGANPALQPFVALGQGLASPIYDYYQALQKYSDKGYQGDFELSKKGIVDFGKNLLRVGEEFAAQKPIQMAAGRTLGGLEAIQEGLSQFGTAAAAADTSKLKPLTDKERFRLGLFAANEVDEKTGDRLYDIDKMYDNYTKNFAASGGKGYFSSPDMLSRFKQFYADGGRVGLFMGGPPLEGQAALIYESMNKYGFSDQEIADALSQRGLYNQSDSTIGGIVQPLKGPIDNIINQINQGRDTEPTRPTSEIVADFQETITNRQNKLNNPGKIASFVGDFIPQQRSVADMLASGQVDKRLTSGIPLGVGSMIAKALPDKYYDMSLADQITTQTYMGFTDPNTNMANKDPFGLNVRSAFGNYAEKAAEIVGTLEEKLARKGTLSKYDQARLDHYRNVTKTKQDAVTDLGLINLAKEQAEAKRQEALKKIQAQGKMDYNPNIHGPVNYGKDSQGNQSFDSGMGFGIGSDGGPVSNRTGRGRTGYSEGGLATMFTRRR